MGILLVGQLASASAIPVVTVLTSATSSLTQTTFVTASLDGGTGTNTCYLASIYGYDVAAGMTTTPTCTGMGLTWTRITNSGDTTRRMAVFRASGTPSVGALTFNWTGGNDPQGSQWIVTQTTNINTTTTNGVVQAVANQAAADTLTVTLASFADATNNICCGFFTSIELIGGGPVTITAGSGFTRATYVEDDAWGSLNTIAAGSAFEYKTGEDTSVDATALAANDYMTGIALELDWIN